MTIESHLDWAKKEQLSWILCFFGGLQRSAGQNKCYKMHKNRIKIVQN